MQLHYSSGVKTLVVNQSMKPKQRKMKLSDVALLMKCVPENTERDGQINRLQRYWL